MEEPNDRPALVEGARATVSRTFRPEEVRAFAELSGDRGRQHLTENGQGRVMVHGLMLASLPTQVGGQLNFLAREMTFEFLRPAWTGVEVRCEVLVVKALPSPKGVHLECSWECTDPAGTVLMRGHGRGLVPP